MSGQKKAPAGGRLKRNPNFFQSSPSQQTGSVPKSLLDQARKTGQLNLSNRGLDVVPQRVWHINDPPPKGDTECTLFESDEHWWDQVELTRLNLSSNEIHEISDDIQNLSALQLLDLQYNKIGGLPIAIGTLTNLTSLLLSHNEICCLPDELGCLSSLQILRLNNNNLTTIPTSITGLTSLEELDLSENQLIQLPQSVASLVHVRILDVSGNNLTEIPLTFGDMRGLTRLSLARNKLTSLPPLDHLDRINEIDLRQNQLTDLPLIQPGTTLKSLLLANNRIASLPEERFVHLTSLTILELRENKISMLPEAIVKLSALERLDLSNNDLPSLPFVMGHMETLQSLLIDGNPLRTLRREIIRKGTSELLKYLRSRIELEPEDITQPLSSPSRTSKISSSPYRELRDESPGRSQEIVLTKQNLTVLSEEIFDQVTTKTFNVSYNKLKILPDLVDRFSELVVLDVRSNQLSDLPMTLSSCLKLRDVYLSLNRFTLLPPVVYDCVSLVNIFANDNQITTIDVGGLLNLKQLSCLDLSNNDIGRVPPELGNMEWLRHLELGGNRFRTPRPAMLTKGTAALLEYLRDRISK